MGDHASQIAGPASGSGTAGLIDHVLDGWRAALPNADITSVSVSISVSRLAALFNRGAEELARQYGFGYGELEVLFYLLSAGKPYEMRPGDLVKGSFVTGGAITGRVDRLSRLGLVTRIPSLIDRRQMVIRLTRNGEKVGRRLRTVVAFESVLSLALQELPEGRRAALDSDLRRVLARMESLVQVDTRASPTVRRRSK